MDGDRGFEESRQLSQNSENFNYDTQIRGHQQGRWQIGEHKKFIEALRKYGKDWGKVQQYVGSRSSTQARSHAQKFFQKISKNNNIKADGIMDLINGPVEPGSKIEKMLYEYDDSAEDRSMRRSYRGESQSQSRRDYRREEEKKDQEHTPENSEQNRSEYSGRYKRFAAGNDNVPEERITTRNYEYQQKQPVRETPAPIYVNYQKKIKKNEYLQSKVIEKERDFSILGKYDEAVRKDLERDLNTMSVIIMNYNGPSNLTSEEKLYKMEPIDRSRMNDKQYLSDRYNEILVRSRRKAAELLEVDQQRFRNAETPRRITKEGYLVELKMFSKNGGMHQGQYQEQKLSNSQHYMKNGSAEGGGIYLLYNNQGNNGKPQGRQVPITKQNVQHDFAEPYTNDMRMMKSYSYPQDIREDPLEHRQDHVWGEEDNFEQDFLCNRNENWHPLEEQRNTDMMNRSNSLNPSGFMNNQGLGNLEGEYGSGMPFGGNYPLPSMNQIESMTKNNNYDDYQQYHNE
ncbi:unnamed protein product [Moneuplotes crassus]|uniref:Uncharacterized protein n=2 Tax=Euplotes crassus TaxID=5936 RepID=A0AAD1X662_EUPCR|nr:unnamed protein product [Moneuplotes crassus]